MTEKTLYDVQTCKVCGRKAQFESESTLAEGEEEDDVVNIKRVLTVGFL